MTDIQERPSKPNPSSPNFPQKDLNRAAVLLMPGTIVGFSGAIHYDTYDLGNANSFIRMNFSPTAENNTGWILCNGGNANRIVFPALFETIGFLYGAGERENEFKVPDYTGYFFRALALNDTVDKGFAEREKYPAPKSTGTKDGVGSIESYMTRSPQDEKQSGNETRPPNIYVNYLIYSGFPATIQR